MAALVASMAIGGSVRGGARVFEPPVRLKADGEIIDSGAKWGHGSPCVVDLNGDGMADLLVGDFSGNFTRYLNVGRRSFGG